MKIPRVAIGAAAVAVAVAFYGVNLWRLQREHEGERMQVPAQDQADEGLAVEATVEQKDQSRTIHLKLGGGEATLVLNSPKGGASTEGFAFGEGSLVAPDRDSGGKFVAAIANWVDTEVPPPRADQTPLEPVPITYVLLGKADGEKPETSKLFFQAAGLDAELYLNLFPDGKRVTLLEKDEDYRTDLVAFLAQALRDGKAPRRSTANDPTMGSDEPLITELTPITETGEDMVLTADGSILGRRGNTLFRWTDATRAPKAVATFDSEVTRLQPAPRGTLVAVTTSKRKDPKVYSSDDPRWLVLWDAASGEKHEIASPDDRCFSAIWSPDAAKLALDVTEGERGNAKSLVRVIDTATRKVLATTDAALDVSPERWTADGLLLRKEALRDDDELEYRDFLWQGTPTPPIPQSNPPEYESPDGRFTIRVATGALSVSTKGVSEAKTFRGSTEEDRSAIEDLASGKLHFVGRHSVVLLSEQTYALDLETLRLRPLCKREDITFHESTPDGTRALFVADDGEHGFLAEVP